jgi:hypothetical protein
MIGVPIAFVLGLTPLVAMMTQGETPLIHAAQRIFTGIDSPILMAVPFLILTDNIQLAGDGGHRHGQHIFMAFGVGKNSSNDHRTHHERHHVQSKANNSKFR